MKYSVWIFLFFSSQYIVKVEFNLESMQFMKYTGYIPKTQARLAATVKLSQLISQILK